VAAEDSWIGDVLRLLASPDELVRLWTEED
jgi:hypothetical protein